MKRILVRVSLLIILISLTSGVYYFYTRTKETIELDDGAVGCFKRDELISDTLNNYLLSQSFQAIHCDTILGSDGEYERLSKDIFDTHQKIIVKFMEPMWDYTKRNNLTKADYMLNSASKISAFIEQNKLDISQCGSFYAEMEKRKNDWGLIISGVMADIVLTNSIERFVCK